MEIRTKNNSHNSLKRKYKNRGRTFLITSKDSWLQEGSILFSFPLTIKQYHLKTTTEIIKLEEVDELSAQKTDIINNRLDGESVDTVQQQHCNVIEEVIKLEGVDEFSAEKVDMINNRLDIKSVDTAQQHNFDITTEVIKLEEVDDLSDEKTDIIKDRLYVKSVDTVQQHCNVIEKVIKLEEVDDPSPERIDPINNRLDIKSVLTDMSPLVQEEYGREHDVENNQLNNHGTSALLADKFCCKICDVTFPQKRYLDLHEEIHFTFTCDKCCKRFSSEASLNDHIKSHVKSYTSHTGHKKQHKCSSCDKTFPYANKLREHERVHTREKPFQCTVCEKCFSQKGALTKHTKNYCERPHKCNDCGNIFFTKSSFTTHKEEGCNNGNNTV